MASGGARTLTRLFQRSRASQQSFRFLAGRHAARSSRRGYASGSGSASSGGARGFLERLGAATVGSFLGISIYAHFRDDDGRSLFTQLVDGKLKKKGAGAGAGAGDGDGGYQKVYDEIAKLLAEKDDYEDGSYGPVLVRLAWHASGTYDAATGTGGSNGATMRFAPESDHGANAGLKVARDFLEPVKAKFPWISYSDLWTLAGVCAIQEMQGPKIPWRPGRQDRDVSFCSPDGRLPDASKDQNHIRAIFGRMGFDDREMVALSGAHALGRCHSDRSGYDGPWDFSPTVMTNEYFRLLLDEKWNWKKWKGPAQYEDQSTKTLMMLPTDMALIKDKDFKKHVERYARDGDAFFKDFSEVIVKLFELGVPFTSTADDRITFQTLSD